MASSITSTDLVNCGTNCTSVDVRNVAREKWCFKFPGLVDTKCMHQAWSTLNRCNRQNFWTTSAKTDGKTKTPGNWQVHWQLHDNFYDGKWTPIAKVSVNMVNSRLENRFWKGFQKRSSFLWFWRVSKTKTIKTGFHFRFCASTRSPHDLACLRAKVWGRWWAMTSPASECRPVLSEWCISLPSIHSDQSGQISHQSWVY